MISLELPRIMIAAASSGSGKTMITCGLLQALKDKNINVSAFKCGPDYIDPMFHGKVLGLKSKNLDTFFTDEELTKYLFAKEAKNSDFSLMEGVMGFYDGISGTTVKASSYDLARVTNTPVILIVDTKGMSLSVLALIKGFLEYKKDSNIKGVILNRLSPMLYPRIKEEIESELPVKVLGYLPVANEYIVESRHLGLVTPDEIEDIQEKIKGLANIIKDTVDLDAIIELGSSSPKISYTKPKIPKLEPVTIAIARDEAFCFYYRDNLELMEEMGARLVYFSPLEDEKIPEAAKGVIFYGGYPEIYAKRLSDNKSMLKDVNGRLGKGLPFLAECGGFMYLHEEMEDMEGKSHRMAGIIKGKAFKTDSLKRFGYINIVANEKNVLGNKGCACTAHEFHYFDSSLNGDSYTAYKPNSSRKWSCIVGDEKSAAGFPHMFYYSNPDMIYYFLKKCIEYNK